MKCCLWIFGGRFPGTPDRNAEPTFAEATAGGLRNSELISRPRVNSGDAIQISVFRFPATPSCFSPRRARRSGFYVDPHKTP